MLRLSNLAATINSLSGLTVRVTGGLNPEDHDPRSVEDEACQLPARQTALISNSGPRLIAKTPFDDPQHCLATDSRQWPSRIARSERGLSRRLAKEDRHRLSMALQFSTWVR